MPGLNSFDYTLQCSEGASGIAFNALWWEPVAGSRCKEGTGSTILRISDKEKQNFLWSLGWKCVSKSLDSLARET